MKGEDIGRVGANQNLNTGHTCPCECGSRRSGGGGDSRSGGGRCGGSRDDTGQSLPHAAGGAAAFPLPLRCGRGEEAVQRMVSH